MYVCVGESKVSVAVFGHATGLAECKTFPTRSWHRMAQFVLWSVQPLVAVFTGEESAQTLLSLGARALLFVFAGQKPGHANPVLLLAEAVAKAARPHVVRVRVRVRGRTTWRPRLS